MPALTPERRALREQRRQRAQKAALLERYRDKLEHARALMPQAEALLRRCDVAEREFWLLLGLFESEEKDVLAGVNQSPKSKWFDRIAPRVRGGRGVSGFVARTAARIPELVRSTKNGYVHPTDLGYALVLLMRERFPSLQHADARQAHEPIVLGEPFKLIAAPLWREWIASA